MSMTKIRVVAFGFFLTSTMAVGPIALATPIKGDKGPISVASPRAGIVLVVGSEIKAGDQVRPEKVIAVKVGGEVHKYRRWKEGDRVKKGQLLVRLDDRLARTELLLQRAKLAAGKADYEGAVALQKLYETELNRLLALAKKGVKGVVAKAELDLAKIQLRRSTQEALSKKAAIKVAERKVEKAQTLLALHEIRSPVDGVIQTIYRYPGEAVRAYEVVITIRSSGKQ
jgi:HlyD family secretion protein